MTTRAIDEPPRCSLFKIDKSRLSGSLHVFALVTLIIFFAISPLTRHRYPVVRRRGD